MREAVIVEAVRTPIGRRNGKLKDVHPVVLGSLVLKEIVRRAGIEPEIVEDVVSGCVTQVGEQSLNVARNALQCGFCTPGMLLTAQELLVKCKSVPSREQIREHLSGNYCRCTGYQAIVDAVETVAQARAGQPR